MNRILEVNEDGLYMVVQAGVITADIQKEAQTHGLLYAGDPCSGDSCCIGGNGATNAGGNRAVNTARRGIRSMLSKLSRRRGKWPA